jgi:hypothetical protein
MKNTALSLLLIALPCLAADRIVELRASTNSPAVYQVPEGKLATVIGRNYERGGFSPWASVLRPGDRTNYIAFDEIGNSVQGPASISLQVAFRSASGWLLLREWEPVPVVPAGSGAVLTLETSSDLSAWQPALRTNLPAVKTNRFFRIKLEPVR